MKRSLGDAPRARRGVPLGLAWTLILLLFQAKGATAQPSSYFLYGAGPELGGYLLLGEQSRTPSETFSTALPEEIERFSDTTVRWERVGGWNPAQWPVIFLLGFDPQVWGQGLGNYLTGGGTVIAVAADESDLNALRDWIGTTYTSDALTALPPESLQLTAATLPEPLRPTASELAGFDVLRIEGEIRLILLRRPLAPELSTQAQRRMLAGMALIAALRSPYVRRLAGPPFQIQAQRIGGDISLRVESDLPSVERIRLQLFDLTGRQVAEAVRRGGRHLTLRAPIAQPPFDPGSWYLEVSLQGATPLVLRRALRELLGSVAVRVSWEDPWRTGVDPHIGVTTVRMPEGTPIPNARIEAQLLDQGVPFREASAHTDASGLASVRFSLPPETIGDWTLRLRVYTSLGDAELERSVRRRREGQLLLTPERRSYLPGETLRYRVVALETTPGADQDERTARVVLLDPQGRRIAQNLHTLGAVGGRGEIPLDESLPAGTYRLVANGEGLLRPAETRVTVRRSAPVHFRVTLRSQEEIYLPGEPFRLELSTEDPDGSTARLPVEIVGERPEGRRWEPFVRMTAYTDPSGRYSFEMDPPDGYRGVLRVRAWVRRPPAEESATVYLAVDPLPWRVQLRPESVPLQPNVETRLYLRVSSPSGKGIPGARITVRSGGEERTAQTNALGIATLPLRPEASGRVELLIRAGGRQIALERRLPVRTQGEGVALSVPQLLWRAGETIPVSLRGTAGTPATHVRLQHRGQTIQLRGVPLLQGVGRTEFFLPPWLAGPAELLATPANANSQALETRLFLWILPSGPSRPVLLTGEETYQLQFPGAWKGLLWGYLIGSPRERLRPSIEDPFLQEELLSRLPEEDLPLELDESLWEGYIPFLDEGRSQARRTPVVLDLNQLAGEERRRQLREQLTPLTAEVQRAIQRFLADEGPERLWLHPDLLKTLVTYGYLRGDLRDPWGHPLQMNYPIVESAGPDGKYGTDDDVQEILSVPPELSPRVSVPPGGELNRPPAPPVEIAATVEEDPFVQLKEFLPLGEGTNAPMPERFGAEITPIRVEEAREVSLRLPPETSALLSGGTWSLRLWALPEGRPPQRWELLFPGVDRLRVEWRPPPRLQRGDWVGLPILLRNPDSTQARRVQWSLSAQGGVAVSNPAGEEVLLNAGQAVQRTVSLRAIEEGAALLTLHVREGAGKAWELRAPLVVLPSVPERHEAINGWVRAPILGTTVVVPQGTTEPATLLLQAVPRLDGLTLPAAEALGEEPLLWKRQRLDRLLITALALGALQERIGSPQERALRRVLLEDYQFFVSQEMSEPSALDRHAGWSLFESGWALIGLHTAAPWLPIVTDALERLQGTLLQVRRGDGSWPAEPPEAQPSPFYLPELRTTAFLAWALRRSGLGPAALRPSAEYLKAHWTETEDVYSLALAANALSLLDPQAEETQALLDDLEDRAARSGEGAYWPTDRRTFSGAEGELADRETAAWALLALQTQRPLSPLVVAARNYLIERRSAQGLWETPHGTALALLALTAQPPSPPPRGTLRVVVDSQPVASLQLDNSTGPIQTLPLGSYAPGVHIVRLSWNGTGAWVYQFLLRWRPARPPAEPEEAPFSIRREFPEGREDLRSPVLVRFAVISQLNRPSEGILLEIDLGPMRPLLADLHQQQRVGTIGGFSLSPDGRLRILWLEVPPQARRQVWLRVETVPPCRFQALGAKAVSLSRPDQSATLPPLLWESSEDTTPR